MSRSLAERLRDAVASSPLAERLAEPAQRFARQRGDDAAASSLPEDVLRGLARVLATRPETAGFLEYRPELLERMTALTASSLDERGRVLDETDDPQDLDDLESALDGMRLLRREETALAAVCDLGGLCPFETVSVFLSQLAESITRQALTLAHRNVAPGTLSVLGMGKIAGREFTYHSDLDLTFLFSGGADAVDDASRVGQRLISYLTTMTGAGIAYPVDTRLRPSGQQGMLVTSLARYEAYQCERAEIWEHVAVLRARAIAGNRGPAQEVVTRIHSQLLAEPTPPWEYLRDLRQRVEDERAHENENALAFKTGRGGLMDVDFLAAGGLLERGGQAPELPAVPALLRGCAQGPRVDALTRDYAFLRLLEARVRWLADRGVESAPTDAESLALVAELVEPGLAGEALRERLSATRRAVRGAYDAVQASGSIAALEASD